MISSRLRDLFVAACAILLFFGGVSKAEPAYCSLPIPADAPEEERVSPFQYVAFAWAQLTARKLCDMDVGPDVSSVLRSIEEKGCGPTSAIYRVWEPDFTLVSKMSKLELLKLLRINDPVIALERIGLEGDKAKEFSKFCSLVAKIPFPDYDAEALRKLHTEWLALELKGGD